MRLVSLVAVIAAGLILVDPASAGPFFFSTGDPDGRIATASRPASSTTIEIESADDFVLNSQTLISQATFTGLLPAGATASSIGAVGVEIYRVFPLDSDVRRTSGPPTFSTSQVPTRVNSPSDVVFVGRSVADGNLSFGIAFLNPSFTATSSIINDINPTPNQTTGGEGSVTGEEVVFTANFSSSIDLPAGHYFFVPQVEVAGGAGNFLWLSAPRPIISPGSTFTPDLQSWIRNGSLAPDWLRVGTDIVGGTPAPTFNAAFSLTGETESVAVAAPEPSTLSLFGFGALALLGHGSWQRRRR